MKTVTDWFKKHWVALAIITLLVVAFLFLWPKKEVPVENNAVAVHKFDSVVYIKTNDSLKGVIALLEEQIIKRELSWSRTVQLLSKKTSTVQTLPKEKVTETFSDRIHVDVVLTKDSNVITPIQGIRNALVLFYELDGALAGVEYYSGQDSLKTALIGKQKELINIKDTRIVKLTSEFYESQATITGLNADIEKQKRKVRNRNRIIGITAGVAAVGILVAGLK